MTHHVCQVDSADVQAMKEGHVLPMNRYLDLSLASLIADPALIGHDKLVTFFYSHRHRINVLSAYLPVQEWLIVDGMKMHEILIGFTIETHFSFIL